MTPSSDGNEFHRREYERLRDLALGDHEGGGWGMRLLMTRGMAAWLAANPARKEVPSSSRESVSDSRPLAPFRQNLVAILAGMVMGALGEGLPCRT